MTVPTLMQNHQRKIYVTQLHQFYNIMSQALISYQSDNNAVNLKEAGLNNLNSVEQFMAKYFKIVTSCGNKLTPCFAETYKSINGISVSVGLNSEKGKVFTISSGQSVQVKYNNGEGAEKYLLVFLVDVNGTKGPNIRGRDLFSIYIYNLDNGWLADDLQTAGGLTQPLTKEYRDTQFNSFCLNGNYNNLNGCFGKILNDNWEMTY